MKFKTNQQLVTKCPERMGNITILYSYELMGRNYYAVLTDWGNIVKAVSEEEMEMGFYVPEWDGLLEETLTEKIKKRIELLQEALIVAKDLEG